jgi:hypothetical protein
MPAANLGSKSPDVKSGSFFGPGFKEGGQIR